MSPSTRREVERALLHLDLVEPVGGGDPDLVLGRNRLEDAGVLFMSCSSSYWRLGGWLDSSRRLGSTSSRGDRDLDVAPVEAGGDQGLVGGLVEVGAELAERGFAEDAAHALLDPGRQLGGLAGRRAGHLGAFQLHRGFDPLACREAIGGAVGDQRRGAHRQRGADGALPVEHGAQRQQVIAQPFQGRRPLAAELEAAHRPGQRAGRVGPRLQRLGKLDQLLPPPPRSSR